VTAATGPAQSVQPVRARARVRGGRLRRQRARTAYLFLAPALIFFALMFFYPLGSELVTSMFSGVRAETFVGTGNYRRALDDPAAWHSFRITLVFAVGVVVLSLLIGLTAAVVLNGRMRGRVMFRGILLVPYLTSIAIVGLLWRNILDPQLGILNRILTGLGLPGQNWLNDHPVATIIGIATWQEIGYATLLFLAGLQGIDATYYEAARVDGASPWQQFRRVTLPLLVPTTLFVSIIGMITSLQQFALPYLVTDGGPGDASNLFVYRIYQTAFDFRDFGYASALSYLLLVVILALSIAQLRLGRRNGGV
jgi:multiple sugar transport system permease protein